LIWHALILPTHQKPPPLKTLTEWLSSYNAPMRYSLRTLLILITVLAALIGLICAYRDWLADVIIDEWLMRGIP